MDKYELRGKMAYAYWEELGQYDKTILRDRSHWHEWVNEYLFTGYEWLDIFSDDGQIVGFLILGKRGRDVPEGADYFIEQAYIRKEYRRKGLMTKALERYVRQGHYGKYALWVLEGNVIAQLFWQSVFEYTLNGEWLIIPMPEYKPPTAYQWCFEVKERV